MEASTELCDLGSNGVERVVGLSFLSCGSEKNVSNTVGKERS